MEHDPTGTGQSPDYVHDYGQGYGQEHVPGAFTGSDPAYPQANPEWPTPEGQQQYWQPEGYGYPAEQQQYYPADGYAQQPYPQQEYQDFSQQAYQQQGYSMEYQQQ